MKELALATEAGMPEQFMEKRQHCEEEARPCSERAFPLFALRRVMKKENYIWFSRLLASTMYEIGLS